LYHLSDAVLARVEAEKRCALIKAWEENEKAKAENKYETISNALNCPSFSNGRK
jgi:hypothetical protein